MEYIRSGGIGTFSFVAFLMCAGQAAMMTADVYDFPSILHFSNRLSSVVALVLKGLLRVF